MKGLISRLMSLLVPRKSCPVVTSTDAVAAQPPSPAVVMPTITKRGIYCRIKVIYMQAGESYTLMWTTGLCRSYAEARRGGLSAILAINSAVSQADSVARIGDAMISKSAFIVAMACDPQLLEVQFDQYRNIISCNKEARVPLTATPDFQVPEGEFLEHLTGGPICNFFELHNQQPQDKPTL